MFITKPIEERLFEKVEIDKLTGCWLFIGYCSSIGYGQIYFNGNVEKAHRVSWILHRGEIPYGLKVLHKCDVRNCINPEHLFLGTQGDNNLDMYAKGRRTHQGGNNPRCALTESDVLEVRALLEQGFLGRQVAEKFNIAVSTVYMIKNRKTWTHI